MQQTTQRNSSLNHTKNDDTTSSQNYNNITRPTTSGSPSLMTYTISLLSSSKTEHQNTYNPSSKQPVPTSLTGLTRKQGHLGHWSTKMVRNNSIFPKASICIWTQKKILWWYHGGRTSSFLLASSQPNHNLSESSIPLAIHKINYKFQKNKPSGKS